VQGIKAWSLDPRMPMFTNRSVTLIVGDDEDHVGFLAESGLRGLNGSQAEGRGNDDEHRIYEVTGHGRISFQWDL
jgi:hypothetical protein